MSISTEEAQQRLKDIPELINKLNAEYNQLLGYIEGLKVKDEPEKKGNKSK
mgnify:CR=1 FL=1